MDNVANNNKVVLKTDTKYPVTMELEGDVIVLREYVKMMRLGPMVSKWVLEQFTTAVKSGYLPEEKLNHMGKVALTISAQSGFYFIIGTNVRFVMRTEIARLFTDSLRAFICPDT